MAYQQKCPNFDSMNPFTPRGTDPSVCYAVYSSIAAYCTEKKGHYGQHHAHGKNSGCYAIWGEVNSETEGLQVVKENAVPDPETNVTKVHFVPGDLPSARIGGKAVGLWRLAQEIGVRVPDYVVFPVAKPPVEPVFPGYISEFSFLRLREVSVRSGAPVSMPGMLRTKIPVKGLDNIKIAVREVYESWNSPEAVAYREVNEIPDTGTAVIVQTVPRNIKYSGVAFTSDPNGDSGYAPIVQAVEGLGDKLVGGESKALDVSPDDTRFTELFQSLLRIHKRYGPSDVEWCASMQEGLLVFWFLQHRALKFAKKSTQPSVQVPQKSSKSLDLMSIGAKSYAVIQKLEDCLHIKDFSPEMYGKMLKSKCIFTETGASTCHAAIVARELGLPACLMSAEDFERYVRKPLLKERQLLIDGATSELWLLPKDYVADAQVKEVVKYVRKVKDPQIQKLENSYIAIAPLMIDFYARLDSGDRERIREYAEIIGAYLYYACIAELRHIPNQMYKSARESQQYFKIWKKFREKYGKITDLVGTKSRDAFLRQLPELSQADKTRVVSFAYAFFYHFNWHGSYGGKKWSVITKHLLLWMIGRISDTLFMDGVFNLKHNSCLVFNKRPNVHIGLVNGDDGLARLLDYKRSCGKLTKSALTMCGEVLHNCTLDHPIEPYWSSNDISLAKASEMKPPQIEDDDDGNLIPELPPSEAIIGLPIEAELKKSVLKQVSLDQESEKMKFGESILSKYYAPYKAGDIMQELSNATEVINAAVNKALDLNEVMYNVPQVTQNQAPGESTSRPVK